MRNKYRNYLQRLPKFLILFWLILNLITIPIAASIDEKDSVSVKQVGSSYIQNSGWSKITPVNRVIGNVAENDIDTPLNSAISPDEQKLNAVQSQLIGGERISTGVEKTSTYLLSLLWLVIASLLSLVTYRFAGKKGVIVVISGVTLAAISYEAYAVLYGCCTNPYATNPNVICFKGNQILDQMCCKPNDPYDGDSNLPYPDNQTQCITNYFIPDQDCKTFTGCESGSCNDELEGTCTIMNEFECTQPEAAFLLGDTSCYMGCCCNTTGFHRNVVIPESSCNKISRTPPPNKVFYDGITDPFNCNSLCSADPWVAPCDYTHCEANNTASCYCGTTQPGSGYCSLLSPGEFYGTEAECTAANDVTYYNVSGRIYNESSDPVPGAIVFSTGISVSADVGGNYTLILQGGRQYRIWAFSYGYDDNYTDVSTLSGQTSGMDITLYRAAGCGDGIVQTEEQCDGIIDTSALGANANCSGFCIPPGMPNQCKCMDSDGDGAYDSDNTSLSGTDACPFEPTLKVKSVLNESGNCTNGVDDDCDGTGMVEYNGKNVSNSFDSVSDPDCIDEDGDGLFAWEEYHSGVHNCDLEPMINRTNSKGASTEPYLTGQTNNGVPGHYEPQEQSCSDNIDNDCDGIVDNCWEVDSDGDGLKDSEEICDFEPERSFKSTDEPRDPLTNLLDYYNILNYNTWYDKPLEEGGVLHEINCSDGIDNDCDSWGWIDPINKISNSEDSHDPDCQDTDNDTIPDIVDMCPFEKSIWDKTSSYYSEKIMVEGVSGEYDSSGDKKCNDGIDNDCDSTAWVVDYNHPDGGYGNSVDSTDLDCIEPEICTTTSDEDNNDLVGCSDPACYYLSCDNSTSILDGCNATIDAKRLAIDSNSDGDLDKCCGPAELPHDCNSDGTNDTCGGCVDEVCEMPGDEDGNTFEDCFDPACLGEGCLISASSVIYSVSESNIVVKDLKIEGDNVINDSSKNVNGNIKVNLTVSSDYAYFVVNGDNILKVESSTNYADGYSELSSVGGRYDLSSETGDVYIAVLLNNSEESEFNDLLFYNSSIAGHCTDLGVCSEGSYFILSGFIFNEDTGVFVSDATISYNYRVSGRAYEREVQTNILGKYTLSIETEDGENTEANFPTEELHSVVVTKPGFYANDSEKFDKTQMSTDGFLQTNFTIKPKPLVSLHGNITDNESVLISDAYIPYIVINGKEYWTNNGQFSVNIGMDTPIDITAGAMNYMYTGAPVIRSFILSDLNNEQNFELDWMPCLVDKGSTQLVIEQSYGNHAMNISWIPSCPAVNYTVYRCERDGKDNQCTDFVPILGAINLPNNTFRFSDHDIEGGKTYCYNISSHYREPFVEFYFSQEGAQCITIKDEACIDQSGEYCADNKRMSCTNLKAPPLKDYEIQDCNQMTDDNNHYYDGYCVRDSDNIGKTKCVEKVTCEGCSLSLGSFAYLAEVMNSVDFFSEDEDTVDYPESSTCTNFEYCYLDSDEKSVDTYLSCDGVESCYDYNSELACTGDNLFPDFNNRCLRRNCTWEVDTRYSELGIGVCRELSLIESCTNDNDCDGLINVDDPDDDNDGSPDYMDPDSKTNIDKLQICSLCDVDSENPFERCDSTRCSLYGQCYFDGEECINRKDMNCYQYQEKDDCEGLVNAQSVEVNVTWDGFKDIQVKRGALSGKNHNITQRSTDLLDLGVCRWGKSHGSDTDGPSCIKDTDSKDVSYELDFISIKGTAIAYSDCGLNSGNDNIINNCKRLIDMAPPVTLFDLDPVYGKNMTIFFYTSDELSSSVSTFCAGAIETDSVPYPSEKEHDCGNTNITERNLIDEISPGEEKNITISYYSYDDSHNLEHVGSFSVLVDKIPPAVSVRLDRTNTGNETGYYYTNLSITIDVTDEKALCDFTLSNITDTIDPVIINYYESHWDLPYDLLPDGYYTFEVSCEDRVHNLFHKIYKFRLMADSSIFDPYPDLVTINDDVVNITFASLFNATCRMDLGNGCIGAECQDFSDLSLYNYYDPSVDITKNFENFPASTEFNSHEFCNGDQYDDEGICMFLDNYTYWKKVQISENLTYMPKIICRYKDDNAQWKYVPKKPLDMLFTYDKVEPITELKLYDATKSAWHNYTVWKQEHAFALKCTDYPIAGLGWNQYTANMGIPGEFGCGNVSFCLGDDCTPQLIQNSVSESDILGNYIYLKFGDSGCTNITPSTFPGGITGSSLFSGGGICAEAAVDICYNSVDAGGNKDDSNIICSRINVDNVGPRIDSLTAPQALTWNYANYITNLSTINVTGNVNNFVSFVGEIGPGAIESFPYLFDDFVIKGKMLIEDTRTVGGSSHDRIDFLRFRQESSDKYYSVAMLLGSGTNVELCFGASEISGSCAGAGSSLELPLNKQVPFRLEVSGNQLDFYINNTKELDFTDSRYSKGEVVFNITQDVNIPTNLKLFNVTISQDDLISPIQNTTVEVTNETYFESTGTFGVNVFSTTLGSSNNFNIAANLSIVGENFIWITSVDNATSSEGIPNSGQGSLSIYYDNVSAVVSNLNFIDEYHNQVLTTEPFLIEYGKIFNISVNVNDIEFTALDVFEQDNNVTITIVYENGTQFENTAQMSNDELVWTYTHSPSSQSSTCYENDNCQPEIGTYNLTINAYDRFRNLKQVSAVFTVNDTIPPLLELNRTIDDMIVNISTQTISGNYTEAKPLNLTVQVFDLNNVLTNTYYNDSLASGQRSFNFTVTLTEGPNYINVTASDRYGNVNRSQVIITLDTTPPFAKDIVVFDDYDANYPDDEYVIEYGYSLNFSFFLNDTNYSGELQDINMSVLTNNGALKNNHIFPSNEPGYYDYSIYQDPACISYGNCTWDVGWYNITFSLRDKFYKANPINIPFYINDTIPPNYTVTIIYPALTGKLSEQVMRGYDYTILINSSEPWNNTLPVLSYFWQRDGSGLIFDDTVFDDTVYLSTGISADVIDTFSYSNMAEIVNVTNHSEYNITANIAQTGYMVTQPFIYDNTTMKNLKLFVDDGFTVNLQYLTKEFETNEIVENESVIISGNVTTSSSGSFKWGFDVTAGMSGLTLFVNDGSLQSTTGDIEEKDQFTHPDFVIEDNVDVNTNTNITTDASGGYLLTDLIDFTNKHDITLSVDDGVVIPYTDSIFNFAIFDELDLQPFFVVSEDNNITQDPAETDAGYVQTYPPITDDMSNIIITLDQLGDLGVSFSTDAGTSFTQLSGTNGVFDLSSSLPVGNYNEFVLKVQFDKANPEEELHSVNISFTHSFTNYNYSHYVKYYLNKSDDEQELSPTYSDPKSPVRNFSISGYTGEYRIKVELLNSSSEFHRFNLYYNETITTETTSHNVTYTVMNSTDSYPLTLYGSYSDFVGSYPVPTLEIGSYQLLVNLTDSSANFHDMSIGYNYNPSAAAGGASSDIIYSYKEINSNTYILFTGGLPFDLSSLPNGEYQIKVNLTTSLSEFHNMTLDYYQISEQEANRTDKDFVGRMRLTSHAKYHDLENETGTFEIVGYDHNGVLGTTIINITEFKMHTKGPGNPWIEVPFDSRDIADDIFYTNDATLTAIGFSNNSLPGVNITTRQNNVSDSLVDLNWLNGMSVSTSSLNPGYESSYFGGLEPRLYESYSLGETAVYLSIPLPDTFYSDRYVSFEGYPREDRIYYKLSADGDDTVIPGRTQLQITEGLETDIAANTLVNYYNNEIPSGRFVNNITLDLGDNWIFMTASDAFGNGYNRDNSDMFHVYFDNYTPQLNYTSPADNSVVSYQTFDGQISGYIYDTLISDGIVSNLKIETINMTLFKDGVYYDSYLCDSGLTCERLLYETDVSMRHFHDTGLGDDLGAIYFSKGETGGTNDLPVGYYRINVVAEDYSGNLLDVNSSFLLTERVPSEPVFVVSGGHNFTEEQRYNMFTSAIDPTFDAANGEVWYVSNKTPEANLTYLPYENVNISLINILSEEGYPIPTANLTHNKTANFTQDLFDFNGFDDGAYRLKIFNYKWYDGAWATDSTIGYNKYLVVDTTNPVVAITSSNYTNNEYSVISGTYDETNIDKIIINWSYQLFGSTETRSNITELNTVDNTWQYEIFVPLTAMPALLNNITINVTAVDKAGNSNQIDKIVLADLLFPAITLDHYSTPTNKGTINVTGLIDQPDVETVTITVEDEYDNKLEYYGLSVYNGSDYTYEIPINLQEGNNTVQAIATDYAGNDGLSYEQLVVLDTVPPEFDNVMTPFRVVSGVLSYDLINISFDSSDDIEISTTPNITVKIGGMDATYLSSNADNTSHIFLFNLSTLPSGAEEGNIVSFNITGYDKAGNLGHYYFTREIDRTPPTIDDPTDPSIDPPKAICGNNNVEINETCDGTLLSGNTCSNFDNFTGGTLSCYAPGDSNECKLDTTQCVKPLSYCGDGIIDPEETCDGANLNGDSCTDFDGFVSGTLSCYPAGHSDSCHYDTRNCVRDPPNCGDGTIDPDETCDGTELSGKTCTSFTSFISGTLSCYATGNINECRLDTSLCNEPLPSCGDGVININETCDDTNLDGKSCTDFDSFTGGTLSCYTSGNTKECQFDTSLCNEPAQSCGDGDIDPDETCDGINLDGKSCTDFDSFTGGDLSCGSTCHFDTSSCTGGSGAGVCGDDVININETCDNTNLNGKSCTDFDGFDGGTLSCYSVGESDECHFNTTGCTQPAPYCGDGNIDPDETCDGINLDGKSCTDFDGFDGGTLSCYSAGNAKECLFDTSSCTQPASNCGDGNINTGETCDTLNLDGNTCTDLGFDSGIVFCYSAGHANECHFNTTGCVNNPPVCGDGQIYPTETCDGTNLDGKTCLDFDNFDGGTLSCGSTCHFDTSSCTKLAGCGDGLINSGETCDGTNLTGKTCSDFDTFTGGSLSCASNCRFDTSRCTGGVGGYCGDDFIQAGETCDGTNITHVCSDFDSFTGGTISCDSNCNVDTSSCTGGTGAGTCGDGVINTGETCDGSNVINTCSDFDSFTGGLIGCDLDCHIDTTRCTGGSGKTCGDSIVEAGETCDGTNLDEKTCLSFGSFAGGLLTCDSDCQLNTQSCYEATCGNSVVEVGETCDNTYLSNKECSDFGFNGGSLSCDSGCHFDTSQCTYGYIFETMDDSPTITITTDENTVCEYYIDGNTSDSGASVTVGSSHDLTLRQMEMVFENVTLDGGRGVYYLQHRDKISEHNMHTVTITCSDLFSNSVTNVIRFILQQPKRNNVYYREGDKVNITLHLDETGLDVTGDFTSLDTYFNSGFANVTSYEKDGKGVYDIVYYIDPTDTTKNQIQYPINIVAKNDSDDVVTNITMYVPYMSLFDWTTTEYPTYVGRCEDGAYGEFFDEVDCVFDIDGIYSLKKKNNKPTEDSCENGANDDDVGWPNSEVSWTVDGEKGGSNDVDCNDLTCTSVSYICRNQNTDVLDYGVWLPDPPEGGLGEFQFSDGVYVFYSLNVTPGGKFKALFYKTSVSGTKPQVVVKGLDSPWDPSTGTNLQLTSYTTGNAFGADTGGVALAVNKLNEVLTVDVPASLSGINTLEFKSFLQMFQGGQWVGSSLPTYQNITVTNHKTALRTEGHYTDDSGYHAWCNDGIDNDLNGVGIISVFGGSDYVDCRDPDCDGKEVAAGLFCENGTELNCSDRFDNDHDNWQNFDTPYPTLGNTGDGKYDCFDDDCHVTAGNSDGDLCQYQHELNCTDGFNNDFFRNTLTNKNQWQDTEGNYDCTAVARSTVSTDVNSYDQDCNRVNDVAGQCPTDEHLYADNSSCFDDKDSDLDSHAADGGIDCYDIDCDKKTKLDVLSGNVWECQYRNETTCNDGFNNDRDFSGSYALMDCLSSCARGSGMKYISCKYETDCDRWNNDGCPTNERFYVNGSEIPDACGDGIDNDLDFKHRGENESYGVDCQDLDCNGVVSDKAKYAINPLHGLCEHGEETECYDGFDNDGDGFIDADDDDCRDGICGDFPDYENITLDSCGNRIDEDNGGGTDCDDIDCAGRIGRYPGSDDWLVCGIASETNETCNDGINNDGDAYADCKDSDCQNMPYCPKDEKGPGMCYDGFDNDFDGNTDTADPDCYSTIARWNGGTQAAYPLRKSLSLPNGVTVYYNKFLHIDDPLVVNFYSGTSASTMTSYLGKSANPISGLNTKASFSSSDISGPNQYATSDLSYGGTVSSGDSLYATSDEIVHEKTGASGAYNVNLSVLVNDDSLIRSPVTMSVEAIKTTLQGNTFTTFVSENEDPVINDIIKEVNGYSVKVKVEADDNATGNSGIAYCMFDNTQRSNNCEYERSYATSGTKTMNIKVYDGAGNIEGQDITIEPFDVPVEEGYIPIETHYSSRDVINFSANFSSENGFTSGACSFTIFDNNTVVGRMGTGDIEFIPIDSKHLTCRGSVVLEDFNLLTDGHYTFVVGAMDSQYMTSNSTSTEQEFWLCDYVINGGVRECKDICESEPLIVNISYPSNGSTLEDPSIIVNGTVGGIVDPSAVIDFKIFIYSHEQVQLETHYNIAAGVAETIIFNTTSFLIDEGDNIIRVVVDDGIKTGEALAYVTYRSKGPVYDINIVPNGLPTNFSSFDVLFSKIDTDGDSLLDGWEDRIANETSVALDKFVEDSLWVANGSFLPTVYDNNYIYNTTSGQTYEEFYNATDELDLTATKSRIVLKKGPLNYNITCVEDSANLFINCTHDDLSVIDAGHYVIEVTSVDKEGQPGRVGIHTFDFNPNAPLLTVYIGNVLFIDSGVNRVQTPLVRDQNVTISITSSPVASYVSFKQGIAANYEGMVTSGAGAFEKDITLPAPDLNGISNQWVEFRYAAAGQSAASLSGTIRLDVKPPEISCAPGTPLIDCITISR